MEEIKLQQGTLEVHKNLWNWKYVANEIIRIQNWTNQRRGLEEFSPGSSVNFHSARYGGAITLFLHMCVALRTFTSRAHRKFFLHPGGALHMYMALWLFNRHLRWALLQFNFLSVFTSCEQTLKIHIVPTEAQKNLDHLASISLIIFSMSKGLNSHTYLVTLSL